MRLLIDVDGCICTYNFKALVKKSWGVEIKNNSIYAYNLDDVLGVTPQEINDMFKEQVYGRANHYPGALNTLREWKGKHEIIIYTNRLKYMSYVDLVKWLTDNLIPFDGIDETGSGEYDFHVDDSPAKLASTNSKVKLLFNQTWNKDCMDIKGIFVRVSNWKEIGNYIKEAENTLDLALNALKGGLDGTR